MNILHISAECYPIAKVGGLADVVGALPKYQRELNVTSNVVMPFYNNKFTQNNSFDIVHEDQLILGYDTLSFKILKLTNSNLEFDLYCVDIPELIYKEYVYSADDTERFLAFQIATLDWISSWQENPDIIHIHDHHTGLIPFMMTQSYKYKSLRFIPTILTIHNAQYQGWFSHRKVYLIPEFNFKDVGLLDWNSIINPLAAAIKCAWAVTTVSPSYMNELKLSANGLENLLNQESDKCIGILNGIDWNVWNTETDDYLIKNYTKSTVVSGKKANKEWLCNEFKLDIDKPLFAFIGRLVGEKGSDLFPEIFKKALAENDISILLLGSGNKETEKQLTALLDTENYNAYIGYDEKLSHIIYAGADFILMPSRVEPCGLNQMYSLRYGTMPIVNAIGGLKDTIIDLEQEDGFGIRHYGVTITNVTTAISRANSFYQNKKEFVKNSKKIMAIDHSWNNSAQEYINLYKSLKK
ncbi:glycogen synthase [Polaribacter reichenbachii]|uniref:Glycogen synthase n=1 Tax=Polaribacter reichenbachii TaxID=996801 RepID=A0A1B8U788_9FLAO|nr:glycogen/starch synthase [Polaribacter reichenbachii]APZ46512.1 glycogen synthase [Polaribacter reichenbachii]AUC20377.1 glycogen synthase [Polaribacter reichenbachii]OBY67721.1 glycogen synthase [Polaribacter reichenbachii]